MWGQVPGPKSVSPVNRKRKDTMQGRTDTDMKCNQKVIYPWQKQ